MGLVDVVANIPDVSRHFCCFHLENNMVKKFGASELKVLFWVAAETANFDNFKHIMDCIKAVNKEAHEWLSNIDFNHWCMSKFDTNVKNAAYLNDVYKELTTDRWHHKLTPKAHLKVQEIQKKSTFCTCSKGY
ncbi:uncharacterized protein LOC115696910 [Cannabis sativa]|uniref:uncharacterized protein LOC115696910 n=1 Tax=Cannabis sativa TaxID=3483 RepID=UPI0011DF7D77|nr:uncharacterized protein LOC115696910 [Cannabis sativa]